MTRRRLAALALPTAMIALATGCRGDPWQQYESSLYMVLREPSAAHTAEHAELLGEIVSSAEEAGSRPPPGICIEYALYLDRTDRSGEAQAYLEKELRYYPEAEALILIMTRLLAGEKQLIEPIDES